jgi:hypothetical protein
MIRLRYRPTALFHFKRHDATNKAALTLPMPTPYAVRTAFLAVADDPEASFAAVKAKTVVVRPPHRAVINPCWVKILTPRRSDEPWDNPEAPAEYKTTMSLREYVHIPGDGSSDLYIYIDSLDGIEELPPRVNYFGKRGSFVQFVGQDEAEPPPEPSEGMAFDLDDYSDGATWDGVNVYTTKRPPREALTLRAQPTLTVRGVRHTLYQFEP